MKLTFDKENRLILYVVFSENNILEIINRKLVLRYDIKSFGLLAAMGKNMMTEKGFNLYGSEYFQFYNEQR